MSKVVPMGHHDADTSRWWEQMWEMERADVKRILADRREMDKAKVRFWTKVDPEGPGGCWIWTASLSVGYGRFRVNGKKVLAHRFAYEVFVEPIPRGLVIDHLCRVPACVNPLHLEPVTSRLNTLRGLTLAARMAAKTHCTRGHPFDEVNTKRQPSDRGRRCRQCTNESARRRYHERKKAAA